MYRFVGSLAILLALAMVFAPITAQSDDTVDPFGAPAEAAADPFGEAPVEEAPAETPAALEVTDAFFAQEIWPIFEASCVSCHGEARQRGALRLDSPRAILAGGAGGEVLKAGNPDESSLYTLTILPEDHPDIMPATGDPLSPEQTERIRQWILAGAAFGDWDGPVMAAVPGDVAPAEGAAQFARPGAPQGPDYIEALAKDVGPAPADALARLQDAGALAMPLARDNQLLRVDFNLRGDSITDQDLELLEAVADQITWLNLARTKVSDDGLARIAALPKLTRLHLEHTAITDAGLAHLSGLNELRYLNLFNTAVSDAGLDHLTSLPHLERLFLWQTQATAEGAEKIRAARPEVDINLGWEAAAAANPEEEAPEAAEAMEESAAPEESPEATEEAQPEDLAALFDEGSCCAVAKAEEADCAHPCCVEATAANTVCIKCNPGAEAKLAASSQEAAASPQFDENSCCAVAVADNRACDHPCCVEATAAGAVCATCNPLSA